MSWRNKSSRILSRPIGAPLRQRWRVHGGGAPCVEFLCRSPWPAATLLGTCRGEVGVGLLFPGWRGSSRFRDDVEVESSSFPPWRRSSSTVSSDSRSRVLGACPWPMGVLQRLFSFVWTSDYCGSLQSLCVILSDLGRRRLCVLVSGDGRRRRMQMVWANRGSRDLLVISIFSRALCANRLG
jgi:hypothetical protein